MTLQATARVHRSGFRLDVSVDVAGGAVLAVVGPNGAGKSTLLRLLAGLPVGGDADATVLVGGHDVSGIPTERRPIGVAFQDLRLFPHLDAVANVAFPLRARGRSRPDARAAAEAELAALGIDEATGRRRPHALSGGEAQRVGLARALVSAPELLLLDEPFAAVDAEFRPTARAALTARLRGFTGATVLVTHDPADALLLGDRILVLEDGRATQHASAAEVARRPASRYAANLVGTNLLVATPRGRSCRTAAGTDVVVADDLGTDADGSVAPDAGPSRVGLIVPPSAVALHPTRPVGTPRNVWPVRVGAVELLGTRARVVVVLPSGEELVAEVTLAAIDELGIAAGADLWASVKATEIAVVGGLRT